MYDFLIKIIYETFVILYMKYIKVEVGKPCLIVIIVKGNALTRNNVEIVSKSSFSIVCRMAPILALLGGVLITPLSGHTHPSQ